MRLVRQYWKWAIVGSVIRELTNCAIHGHPFKIVYPNIQRLISTRIRDTYTPLVKRYCHEIETKDSFSISRKYKAKRNRVFFCWLQGIDNAPNLVKACYHSLIVNLSDKEIVIIDNSVVDDWIDIPEDLKCKYRKGIIPNAMYSDLIRLELLTNYGGSWIDSTVLCTNRNYPRHILEDDDLFLFQYRKAKGEPITGISNWFISARQSHPLLSILKTLLYQYWRDFDCVVDYFIFHRFFMMIAEERPDWIKNITPANSLACLVLEQRVCEDVDKEWFERHINRVSFHKMNYRVSEKAIHNKNSYYNHILMQYL